jgi:hypothetical protein
VEGQNVTQGKLRKLKEKPRRWMGKTFPHHLPQMSKIPNNLIIVQKS